MVEVEEFVMTMREKGKEWRGDGFRKKRKKRRRRYERERQSR